jgi:hypothetical protein
VSHADSQCCGVCSVQHHHGNANASNFQASKHSVARAKREIRSFRHSRGVSLRLNGTRRSTNFIEHPSRVHLKNQGTAYREEAIT